jgi:adenine-specific DNA methylase
VANKARWQKEAEQELTAWQARYNEVFESLRADKVKVAEAKKRALEKAGPKPLTAKERADQFYESKMAQVFRRARQLLHPAGRMVVMFNHKQTWAWRSLGMALIRAGFEIRSSVPIHTEAESSLNIRGLDAARSTVLLLCIPRVEKEQVTGNWAGVQNSISQIAQNAAERFQGQGLEGTDLYLSSLGPALGEVARNWPVTDFSGREVDLADALEEAYRSVGQWRLTQVFNELSKNAELNEAAADFSAQSVDRDTQTLWLWLDTFKGEVASSDDVQKLAKSLNVDPNEMKRMGLLATSKDTYVLRAPGEIDLRGLSRRLSGDTAARGREARQADVWEERSFPNFVGAAVWNAIALMSGSDGGAGGADAVKRWLRNSGYDNQKEFFAAYAVTLHLLDKAFKTRKEGDIWYETARQARRAWDLVISSHRI